MAGLCFSPAIAAIRSNTCGFVALRLQSRRPARLAPLYIETCFVGL
ncbi:MAG: hypothetical protein J6B31_05990 [Bacteroidaceae bacterium]|nr:hypothetical protein [Bacteroidaceae bacterium]